MIEIIKNCKLQWDHARGVIYVHDNASGAVLLRISGLERGRNCLLEKGMIDITLPAFVRDHTPEHYHARVCAVSYPDDV